MSQYTSRGVGYTGEKGLATALPNSVVVRMVPV